MKKTLRETGCQLPEAPGNLGCVCSKRSDNSRIGTTAFGPLLTFLKDEQTSQVSTPQAGEGVTNSLTSSLISQYNLLSSTLAKLRAVITPKYENFQ